MADIERLDRALAFIEAHPEQHDQSVWLRKVDCGTAACLAGWVVVQEHPHAGFVQARSDFGNAYSMVEIEIGPQAEPVEVGAIAQALLDITPYQADELFDAGNTIEDLKAMRNLLAADPHVSPAALADIRTAHEDYYEE